MVRPNSIDDDLSLETSLKARHIGKYFHPQTIPKSDQTDNLAMPWSVSVKSIIRHEITEWTRLSNGVTNGLSPVPKERVVQITFTSYGFRARSNQNVLPVCLMDLCRFSKAPGCNAFRIILVRSENDCPVLWQRRGLKVWNTKGRKTTFTRIHIRYEVNIPVN